MTSQHDEINVIETRPEPVKQIARYPGFWTMDRVKTNRDTTNMMPETNKRRAKTARTRK